jgi:hypothetical protein
MTKPTPNPDIYLLKLGLPDTVREQFSFVSQFGLEVVEEDPRWVRYRSERATLSVYYDRGDIDVVFGRPQFPNQAFYLASALKWASAHLPAVESPIAGYQASTREGIIEGLSKIAPLMKRYLVPLLQGDPVSYDQLQATQAADAAAYTADVYRRQIRRDAENA